MKTIPLLSTLTCAFFLSASEMIADKNASAMIADKNASAPSGPQRPVIIKKGTIDLDLCETTPFVFQDKVYRLEWFRSGSILRIMDHDTGKELSRFGAKHRFPCAYVEGDTVYVVGTKETAKWCGNVLTMFITKDLKNWAERPAFTLEGTNICNTSLCKADDRYVMSIEVTQPRGFPARFIESKDLLNWTLMAPEHKHALGRYNAAHCLRWQNDWFYLFYLEAGKPHGYEQYVTRSRDLIKWESSPLNPVLAASPEDKHIANSRLTSEQRGRIAKAVDVNNSDIDFCAFNGRLIINYSWGNQNGTEFIAEAEYAGGLAQFLEGWFPESVVTIVCPANAAPQVKLAAREIRRYVYLRTGVLLPMADAATGDTVSFKIDKALAEQQYGLKSAGKSLVISGGSDVAVLYGAYAFAEKLGVRFYLHGDVIPDERLKGLPVVNETGKPLFALRGLNPWGAHAFGIDAWGTDDYKAVFSQLTKMRMNFLGIHCYPEGHPYAEPAVWLGTRDDCDAQGRVTFSYPSHYYNTLINWKQWSRPFAKKTSTFSFGGAHLFEDDAWAPEVMRGYCPVPETPEACNDVFNRMATQFRDAFGWARELGVKTAVGTESPLVMPKALREKLQQQGKNPDDPATVRDIYEGMFRRIAASHPLDYFWLWTPESWRGSVKPQDYTNTVKDVKLAAEALKNSGAPFKLATCGWVLGPQFDRGVFDADLPKDIPTSALNRELGSIEVDAAFGRIDGREKWVIPWMESDGNREQGLAAIQLLVGRMRCDAAAALAYGCTGLMGLQWRTDIIAPNVSALAQAAWDQSGWNPSPGKVPVGTGTNAIQMGRSRSLPCADFYADWASANFGSGAGIEIGRVFASVDGCLPASVSDHCPSGDLNPDVTPWEKVAARYGCVTELENLRPRVTGAGNVARFDYWLNTFRYHRALHQVRCVLAEFEALLKGQKNNEALAKYKELIALYGETYCFLLATVHSPGGWALVVNLENQPGTWPMIIDGPAKKLVAALGRPLPDDAKPPKAFKGEPRIIVPTVCSAVRRGEVLKVKFVVLDNQPAKSAVLVWRPLGQGGFRKLSVPRVARSTYCVAFPPADESIEYRLEAETADGKALVWPATAPEMNQTVVVW